MPVSSMKDLLEAGVHFGHHTRKWNPKMKAYIYGERNDIYIIDLHKTRKKLEEAYEQVRQMAFNGEKFLFVGTKKQAQDSIREAAESCQQFYVNHRWLGGMLTNWPTIQTRIDRLNQLDRMVEDGTMDKLPKKESARLQEERTKLDMTLGGIRTMNGLPTCIFIVDCQKEHIAIREAHRLEIPIVAVVDTNCDPDQVDHVIPGNDDAIRAVKLMASQMAEAINEGRGMAMSAMEERATAAMSGAVGGAAHFGGGQLDYAGAPKVELPPVDTGSDEGSMEDLAAQDGGVAAGELGFTSTRAADNVDTSIQTNDSIGGIESMARTDAMGAAAANNTRGANDGPSDDSIAATKVARADSAFDVGPKDVGTDGTEIAAGASVTASELEANATTAGLPETTREDNQEDKSERSVGAETPADGTLG